MSRAPLAQGADHAVDVPWSPRPRYDVLNASPRRGTGPVTLAGPRRPSPGFLALAGLVIVAAVAARIALLGRASYWIDELFTVRESSGSLATLRQLGSTEVHPPFYALLLWAWTRLGDSHEVWTRLFSTLCAVASVLVTHRGLRGVRLGSQVRWALTTATAAGGTSLVYSLETRSYALLALTSVGLTTATLRAATGILDGLEVPAATRLGWLGWSLAAATTHLFGAVLTLGSLVVLAVATLARAPGGRARAVLAWAALAAAGCSLQAAWLLHGRSVPGFASGTEWIKAPRAQDVWDLVTSAFSSGGLTMHKDGFAWTSPAGVIAAALLCLVAAGSRLATRAPGSRRLMADGGQARPGRAVAPGVRTTEARAAAILLALTAIVVLAVFWVSQWRHLWTLRNMVIVTPALAWGVICLAAASAPAGAGRRWVATAATLLLGASLVPVTAGLAHPYKTDFRGLFGELAAVRRERPEATFVFLRVNPALWQGASDLPGDDPAWTTLYRHVTIYPTTTPRVIRTRGTEIVVFYRSVVDPRLDQEVAGVITALGGGSCRRIPIQGLGVVRCD
jgi:hypothetical protein